MFRQVCFSWKLEISPKCSEITRNCGLRLILTPIIGTDGESITARYTWCLTTSQYATNPNIVIFNFESGGQSFGIGSGAGTVLFGPGMFAEIPVCVKLHSGNRLNFFGEIVIAKGMFENRPAAQIWNSEMPIITEQVQKLYENFVSKGIQDTLPDFTIVSSDRKKIWLPSVDPIVPFFIFFYRIRNWKMKTAENQEHKIAMGDINWENLEVAFIFIQWKFDWNFVRIEIEMRTSIANVDQFGKRFRHISRCWSMQSATFIWLFDEVFL